MRSLTVVLVLLTSLGAGDVLLTQDFDGMWSTENPPDEWEIIFTDPPNNADWHRRAGGQIPWAENSTPYAAIFFDFAGDTLRDLLITPDIDCSGYRDITLTVNTYFARNLNMPYLAQLRYSTDGGENYPYLLSNYWHRNVGPGLETFTLPHAENAAEVRIAWVFEGNKAWFSHWAIDDVEVTGEPIPTDDIQCLRILSPSWAMFPGDLSPSARFRNNGLNTHTNIPVECRLYDNDWNEIASWSAEIPELAYGETEDVVFDPPITLNDVGQYRIEFWHESEPDENPDNDTLRRAFRVTWIEELRYDNGTAAGYDDWPVGHYGWGVRFEPVVPPVHIESLKVYLRATGTPEHDRYQLAVLRDEAGIPGRFLYRSEVLEAVNGWNSVPLADDGDDIVIGPDEAFYVFYLQVGETPESPALGYDDARSPIAAYWQYRAGDFVPDTRDGDYMIRAVTNRELIPSYDNDLRVTHIEEPRYEFVQRPFDAPVIVRARVHNHGLEPVSDATVDCVVFDSIGNPVFGNSQPVDLLLPGEDFIVNFAPWVPEMSGYHDVEVTVSVPGGDDNPANDAKSFRFEVRKGAYTGTSGTDAYGWTDSDTTYGPAFEWVEHDHTATTVITQGEQYRIYVPVLFDFPYYDTTYANVYVSVNGWLSLGPDPMTNAPVPQVMPDPAVPNRVIAPWWDDLACGPGYGGGRVWARWFGYAPNRRFVVTWEGMNRMGTDTTELITFQAILYESGHIVFQYLDVTTGDLRYDNARNAAIGLEDSLGTDGLAYLYAVPPMSSAVNDLENRVRPGTAIRFNPVRRDIAAIEVVQPVGYVFPTQHIPIGKVQNYGSVVEDFQVYLKIRPGPYTDTVTVSGLMPGDSALVEFAPWEGEVGTYTVTCSTWMDGDVDPTNDVIRATVVVSPWIERPDIPVGTRRRKVRGATMAHAGSLNRLYALKGSNDEELWSYDIIAGEWELTDSVPREPSGRRPRYGNALAYSPDPGAEGTLWVLKGGGTADFYSYDIATRTWTVCSSAVVNTWGYREPRRGAALAYVPAGPGGFTSSVFCLVGNNTVILLRYDIADGQWSVMYDADGQRFQVPWGPRGRRCRLGSGMAFDGNELFVVKGTRTLEAYALNPYTQVVRELDSTGLARNRRGRRRDVRGGGSVGYLDGALYLVKGGNQDEFWKYRIDGDTWVQITDIPFSLVGRARRPRRGSALVGVDTTLFFLKGSHGYEFWEYGPTGDTAVGAQLSVRPGRHGVMAPTGEPLDLQLSAGPNPMNRRLVVRCNIGLREHTRITVYDAGGRLVRRLADAVLEPGRHTFNWDGLDESRRVAPAGVYLLKLESGSLAVTRKLVIQR